MTAKSLTHKFVNSNPDDASVPTLTRPSNWNDDHNFWLGQRVYNSASNDTLIQADHMAWVYYSGATAITSFVPAPAGSGSSATFQLGWTTKIKVVGAGTVTLTPAASSGVTFNGSATPIPLYQGDAAELFSEGNNDYIVLVYRAAGLAGNDGRGGILKYSTATALTYKPYGGNYIRLNRVLRPIGSSGVTGLANTGVYVNGVAGQNLAAGTTYLVFAFDNNGVLTADFVPWAANGHGQSTTPGNEGTEVKFTSGTEDPTRTLLGMVRTNASSQFFEDNVSLFGVASWNNRRWRFMPGNNVGTISGINFTSPTALGGGQLGFMMWAGEQPLIWSFGVGLVDTVNQEVLYEVFANGNNSAQIFTPAARSVTTVIGLYQSLGAMCSQGQAGGLITEGYNTFNHMAWVTGGNGSINMTIGGMGFF